MGGELHHRRAKEKESSGHVGGVMTKEVTSLCFGVRELVKMPMLPLPGPWGPPVAQGQNSGVHSEMLRMSRSPHICWVPIRHSK